MRNAGLTHVTTVPDSLEFLRGQLDYMKARGFRVSGITSPGPELDRLAAEFQIRISPVPMARKITPLADVGAVAAMRRLLRQHRPAIVHTHTPKGGLLGLIAAWSAAIPVRIYHMRGLPFTTATGWRRTLLWQSEWLSCHLAHRVFAVSESVRAVAVREKLCDPSTITVLGHGSGNGVDATGRFNPDALGPEARREVRASLGLRDDDLLVAFIGRIVRDKGVAELVEAWQSIRRAHARARLLVIGPFEPKDAVSKETRLALGTDPRVRLVGMTWEMPRWYTAMDVVVLPSHREGFPNVLLEAAAMGLPVVATRVPGCVDAVADGETGILVPPGEPRPLASAIQVYLSTPALRRHHGAAGRQRVLAHFRPEAIWQALYIEYVRLLGQAGGIADRLACAGSRRW